MRQGRCWLMPPVGDAVPPTAGEAVFLPRASAHGLADAPATSNTSDRASRTLPVSDGVLR
ncbi:AraC family transcriptional regulator [Nonomuraea basaltis]|nr:AraC family transcriptional regulator [Nonomuraea basaltis]